MKQPDAVIQKYSKEDFLSKVYMTEERYEVLAALLRNKKNVILQGAPGVGKTFTAKKLAYALIDQIKVLNKEITDDKSLGRGFQIGHSYFCGRETAGCTDEWMRSVVEFDILPMLSEYWFDEPTRK